MTKKKIVAAALLLAVMTAAAGCGGKGGEKTENAWESIPSAQEPAAAGETATDAGENAGGTAAAEDGSAAAETADAGTEGQTEDPVGALYTGTWVDEIAGRAYMVISPASDGTYDVEINWSSSAAETSRFISRIFGLPVFARTTAPAHSSAAERAMGLTIRMRLLRAVQRMVSPVSR